jgi:hypothetical protein
MIERLLRVCLGFIPIVGLMAAGYAWVYIHTTVGLTVNFYLGIIGVVIAYNVTYMLGDIIITAYKAKKEMKQ